MKENLRLITTSLILLGGSILAGERAFGAYDCSTPEPSVEELCLLLSSEEEYPSDVIHYMVDNLSSDPILNSGSLLSNEMIEYIAFAVNAINNGDYVCAPIGRRRGSGHASGGCRWIDPIYILPPGFLGLPAIPEYYADYRSDLQFYADRSYFSGEISYIIGYPFPDYLREEEVMTALPGEIVHKLSDLLYIANRRRVLNALFEEASGIWIDGEVWDIEWNERTRRVREEME